MKPLQVTDFSQWREAARHSLQAGLPPDLLTWSEREPANSTLFDTAPTVISPRHVAVATPYIPKAFLPLAEKVAYHNDAAKWDLLYQALWRLNHGEKHLMHLESDALVRRLGLMAKAVARDAHKMKAFVRFRKIEETPEHYLAWHNPDHNTLPVTAGFFSRRFSVMQWTILTPFCSAHWDGNQLIWGNGVKEQGEIVQDNSEKAWLAYYRATFNPARVKLKMMRKEMPVRHWATLPETALIPSMLEEAPERVRKMLKYSNPAMLFS